MKNKIFAVDDPRILRAHKEADGGAEKGTKRGGSKKRKRVECRERAMWFLGWQLS